MGSGGGGEGSRVRPYFQDEWVTIYHGDCREVLPTLAPADLLLTDPPYGINFAGQPTKWQRRAGQDPEEWDCVPVQYLQKLLDWGRWQVVWGGNYYTLPPSRGWLCWYKPDAPPSMGQFELAWTNRDTTSRLIKCTIADTNAERVGHPTQKPLKVITWTLASFPEALTVIDPFMGSGTTLVAAKQFGKRAIGIEIEERYCEIAVKRLAQEVLEFA